MPAPLVRHDDLVRHRFAVVSLTAQGSHRLTPAERLLAFMPRHERARAQAMRVPARRFDFVLARAALRSLLAPLLGVAPTDVPIETPGSGKPVLAASARCPVDFNIAHSGNHLVVALTLFGPIGVDVEPVTPYTEWKDFVAREYFHPAESLRLKSMSAEDRAEGYCRLWTAKEACTKARGTGLILPLDDPLVGPGEEGRCGDLWWRSLALDDTTMASVAIRVDDASDVPRAGLLIMATPDALDPDHMCTYNKGMSPTFEYEHSTETAAGAEAVWKLWSDVSTWPLWDGAVEQVDLEGPFATGTEGLMKLRGRDAVPFRLSQVEPGRTFVDETNMPPGLIRFRHEVAPSPGGARITYRVEIEGPEPFAQQVGPMVASAVPEAAEGLARLAEKDAT